MDLNNNKNAEIEKQICNNNNTQILNSEINTLAIDNNNCKKLSSVLNLNGEEERIGQRVTCNKLIIKITLKNKTEVKFVNSYRFFILNKLFISVNYLVTNKITI